MANWFTKLFGAEDKAEEAAPIDIQKDLPDVITIPIDMETAQQTAEAMTNITRESTPVLNPNQAAIDSALINAPVMVEEVPPKSISEMTDEELEAKSGESPFYAHAWGLRLSQLQRK